jgi:hypothetical protein
MAGRAGFRRRATFDVATLALERREQAVAAGRGLGRVDAFIVVRAPSRAALEADCRELADDARRAGIVIERGNGRHAEWLCAQLPGGPAWRALR